MGSDMLPPETLSAGGGPKTDRRQLLGSALVLGAIAVVPFQIWSDVHAGHAVEIAPSLRLILDRVCDLVIPATDTPGALAAKVPDFVLLALRHGLEGTADSTGGYASVASEKGGLVLLEQLGHDLDRKAGGSFTALPQDRQFQLLTKVDADAYAADAPEGAWRKIKTIILAGYYTSEIGASQELQYELVPGRFDPNLPLPVNNRSWSSDWTAVDFG